MSALGREDLIEACRVIYSSAGENYMLPALIRGAANLEATSRHIYYCLAGDRRVRYTVEFDMSLVEPNKFPLSKLPLRFKCELVDDELNYVEDLVDNRERSALIYAFILGVKAPIFVDERGVDGEYSFSLQLSPTFYLEWHETFEADAVSTMDDICRRIALSLYEKSKDLFLSPEDGLTVWSARVAQELFDAPKPTPEALWSSLSLAQQPPSRDGELILSARNRYASILRASEHTRLPAAALGKGSELALPAVTALPALSRRAGNSRFPAVAAAAMVGIAGLQLYLGAARVGGAPSSATLGTLSISENLAPEKLDMISSPIVEAREEAREEAPFAAPAETAVVAALEAPASRTFLPAPSVAPPAKKETAGAPPRKAQGAAAKTAEQSPKAGKLALRDKRKRQSDPLSAVGRAVNHFATGVVKTLKGIPRRLSTL